MSRLYLALCNLTLLPGAYFCFDYELLENTGYVLIVLDLILTMFFILEKRNEHFRLPTTRIDSTKKNS